MSAAGEHDSWQRLETLFGAIVELADERRDEFIDAASGADEGLRAELRRLLAAHRRNDDDFLRPLSELTRNESIADGPVPGVMPFGAPIEIPEHRVIGEIHRGGQGIVYKAVHEPTGRSVAVKVIRHGGFASPSQRARFERERRIVAGLHHPNIVTLYTTDELPGGCVGYSMEYVDGIPMHRWMRDTASEMPVRARLGVFRTICQAIAYAHDCGVIHRDLKPSNVIIDQAGEPRVVDFGLAMLLGEGRSESLTLTGELACTPEYAAPEQLGGGTGRSDRRTDVYALGVLLYELVTGAHPHRTDMSIAETLRNVLEVTPPSPRILCGEVDGDLARIVMKCLAKEPGERYATVAALLDDVERYLGDEPISARAPSAVYHARKFTRRHRRNLLLVAARTVVASVGIVIAMLNARRADVQRGENLQIATALEIDRGRAEWRDGAVAAAEDRLWGILLGRAPERDPARSDDPLTRGAWWALWELYASHPCLETHVVSSEPIAQLVLDGSGERFAIALRGSTALLWNRATRTVETRWERPDERLAAVGLDDAGRLRGLWQQTDGLVRLEVHEARSPRRSVELVSDAGAAVAIDSRGNIAAVVGPDGRIRVRDADGRGRTLESVGPIATPARLHIDDAGARLAWQENGRMGLVDLASGEHRTWSLPRERAPSALCISPDGNIVVTTHGGRVELYQWDSGRELSVPPIVPGEITALAFDPRSPVLWSGGYDRRVTCRRVTDDFRMEDGVQFAGHRQPVGAVAVGADVVVTGDLGGTIKLWDKRPGAAYTGVPDAPWAVHAVAIDDVGGRVAMGGTTQPEGDFAVHLWHGDGAHRRLAGHGDVVSSVAFVPGGDGLLSASFDGGVRHWNLDDGSSIAWPLEHEASINHLDVSDDGRFAVTASDDRTLRVWEVSSRRCVRVLEGHELRVPWAAFSPDGRTIASASCDGTARLWDAETGEARRVLERRDVAVRVAEFSPDGRQLAVGGDDGAIVVHELGSGASRELEGHTDNVFALAYDPDGNSLVSATRTGEVVLWDVRTGRRLANLLASAQSRSIFALAFSPDGRELLVGGELGVAGRLDMTHAARHIAGNLSYQLDLLERRGGTAVDAVGWRAWAVEHLDPVPTRRAAATDR